MKNQMMNLFASYSFYYFPGYYYCADCFCCKKITLSDRRSLDPSET